jgi:formiminoglutamase
VEEGSLVKELRRLAAAKCQVLTSIDADAVAMDTVPGVSAPNAVGLSGSLIMHWAREAGRSAHVSSMELAEISPTHDTDGRSARWGALVVWQFLAGLAERNLRMTRTD